MADFLTVMAESSAARTIIRREQDVRPVVALDLEGHGFDLIAEVKLRGPASGRLAPAGDDRATAVELAQVFARAGASALSVLTEPTAFDGSLEHLAAVAAEVDVPVMRKDFLVSPEQAVEARDHGASGVLVIARILSRDRLEEMVDTTLDLGMFALVEVFDESDLELASVVFDRPILVGVNSRDLSDLSVDFDRFERLAPFIPAGSIKVAESGIETEEDMARVVALGYRLALVGTSLARVEHPELAVRSLLAAGRQAAGSRVQ